MRKRPERNQTLKPKRQKLAPAGVGFRETPLSSPNWFGRNLLRMFQAALRDRGRTHNFRMRCCRDLLGEKPQCSPHLNGFILSANPRILHFGLDLAVVAILGRAVPPEPRSPDLCADDSVEDGRLARSARLCRDCRPSLP